MKNTESPTMTLKVLCELLIKGYEQFYYSEMLSIFTTHYPYEKGNNLRWITHTECAKNYYCNKRRLTAPEGEGVYQKIPVEKMCFQPQKYEKYRKSKNYLKSPLLALNQEL